MDVMFGWYALFALTTAFAAMYELFIPVLNDLKVLEPNDNLVQYGWLTKGVMLIASTLLAPILFPIVLVPAMSTWFKKSLLDELTATPAKI